MTEGECLVTAIPLHDEITVNTPVSLAPFINAIVTWRIKPYPFGLVIINPLPKGVKKAHGDMSSTKGDGKC
jgi:hypothetical protein